MGRYFNIYNITKKETVDNGNGWKGYPECDAENVIKTYNWSTDDLIYTSCYDTICLLTFTESGKLSLIVDVDINNISYLESLQVNNKLSDKDYKDMAEQIIINNNDYHYQMSDEKNMMDNSVIDKLIKLFKLFIQNNLDKDIEYKVHDYTEI